MRAPRFAREALAFLRAFPLSASPDPRNRSKHSSELSIANIAPLFAASIAFVADY